jgi:hypothetical protein
MGSVHYWGVAEGLPGNCRRLNLWQSKVVPLGGRCAALSCTLVATPTKPKEWLITSVRADGRRCRFRRSGPVCSNESKRVCEWRPSVMSALPPKADIRTPHVRQVGDIRARSSNVRSYPNIDIERRAFDVTSRQKAGGAGWLSFALSRSAHCRDLSFSDSLFGAQCLFKRSDSPKRQGKQNALEEAPEADSIPSDEARQRSKPRQRIAGLKDRAADRAMLERHAGQHCSSGSTARYETIPCRSLSQTRV